MNNNINTKPATNKGRIALLFLLSVLMLVISCPLKRLLQKESNVTNSQRSVKWNGSDRKATAYENACSFAKDQQIALVSFDIKKILPASDLPADQNEQSGFALHYFLSGTENQHDLFSTFSLSSLPLFLQHRRMLI